MAALTLRQDGRTHVEDHGNPGFRAVFPRCTGDVGGRHPMVDHALGISATLFSRRSDTLGWARVHYCRRAWIVRFVCALCVAGSGHARADRATTQSRGERIISLCAQSDLCCSRCRHSWSGVLFADWHLLGYGALIWLFFHIVVIAYEEPTLCQSYGAEYESYCANVPRWLPRLTPRAV